MIEIITDRARLDVDFIHRWLSEVAYWSLGIPRELVERAIANSLCFGAFEDGRQIGFARVITDYATFGYIADVFVIESHRGRGAGSLLMRAIRTHPELRRLRRWLLVTRDAHFLYARHGFTPLASPDRLMEVTVKDPYRTEFSSAECVS